MIECIFTKNMIIDVLYIESLIEDESGKHTYYDIDDMHNRTGCGYSVKLADLPNWVELTLF